MVELLNNIDTDLFLFLNGMHVSWLDEPMYWLSHNFIWIPFYTWLAYLFIKQNGRSGWMLFLLVGVVVTLCDQTSSNLIQEIVKRPRPCHEPDIAHLVHLSRMGCIGDYGFASTHSANAFGMATFVSLTLGRSHRWMPLLVFGWATLVAYSRVYNGICYPGDLFVGALIGSLYGTLIVKL